MSFPTASELNSSPAIGRLTDWLINKAWHRDFPKRYRSRGEAYARQDKVLEIKLGHEFVNRGLITASVEGTRRTPYNVHLNIYPVKGSKINRLEVDPNCSCPIGYLCKHTAAVFAVLQQIAETGDHASDIHQSVPPEINHWLETLKTVSKPTPAPLEKKNPSFLAYCLELGWNDEPVLRLHRATHVRSGIKVHAGEASANPAKPASYITEDDFPLIVLFHQNCPDHWDALVPLTKPAAAKIISEALNRGALFADLTSRHDQTGPCTRNHRQLHPGPPLEASPGWTEESDGSVIPTLQIQGSGGDPAPLKPIILPTTPPYYLDSSRSLLGELTGKLPSALLAAWQRGPRVAVTQLENTSAALESLSIPAPLPVQVEAVRLPKSKPKPTLRVRPGDSDIPILGIVGEVQFRYGTCPPLRPLTPDAPPVSSWSEDDKRIVVERDIKAEAKFWKQLAALELEPSEFAYPYRDLPDDLVGTFFLPFAGLSWDLHWILFLDENGPTLEKRGWTIEIDPEAGLVFHDVQDFHGAIGNDTAHGIDWFQFDLHVEVDGSRISLIPHIAWFLENGILECDPAELGEVTYLPVPEPDSGFVRFPSARLLEICQSIAHLFHGKEGPPDGPLRIDRLAAAGVADELELDDSQTVRALTKLGKNLRSVSGLPKVRPPKSLQAELRPYQLEGFRWLRFLAQNQLHGILADDMGLGKTVQTLAHLVADKSKAKSPSLVIAPTSVIGNWLAEAARFTPSLKVILLHGPTRKDLFPRIPQADLVITSYPLLVRDRETLASETWNTVVLDEAQYIKNPKTAAAKAACQLSAEHRLCLSGTPMENHLGELWSLMRFLMPGFLGDEKSFNATLRRPIERHQDSAAQNALNKRISPLLLRRTKTEVASDLPRKTELIHRVTLSPKELDLYESVRALMDKRVREAIAKKGLGQSHIIVLDALLKLRQVCCHPHLLKTPVAKKLTTASKFGFLTTELIPTLLEEGRRILLFSSFTSVLDLIEEHLQTSEVPYLKLTGRTRNRASLVEEFQKGDTPIFLISLKAGGTGLNLTAADTVIHYDPWWNPAAENQATDRAHRIGQTQPVFVHKLICQGGIEDRILDLQAHKARLVEALLSEDTSKLRLNEEALAHLLAPIT